MKAKIILLLVFVMLSAWLAFYFYENNRSFSPGQWSHTATIERHVYARDLVANVLKKGMAKDRVLELLGKPDSALFDYDGSYYMTYVIGRPHGFFNFSAVILLDVTFKGDKLNHANIRED